MPVLRDTEEVAVIMTPAMWQLRAGWPLDLITAAWWKEERGTRVFVDYNQNAPAARRVGRAAVSNSS